MFLITVHDQKHTLSNNRNDDIVGFFPSIFSADKEQIKIELIPEIFVTSIESGMSLDFELEGYVRKVKVTPATETSPEQREFVGEPIKLLKLKKWPYDENGNFLGNEFE